MSELTKSTKFLNHESDAFHNYFYQFDLGGADEQAINWFSTVRDNFRYDPYHLDIRPKALTVDNIITKKKAWCVEKAIVLATGFRYLGLPSKLGYGIVVNHIGVEKLEKYLKRPEIVFHGYVNVFYNNKWQKVTPAFDKLTCRASKVDVMKWNGTNDLMFQQYNKNGNKFMEYVHYYGEFTDVPIDLMNQEMEKYYPQLFEGKYDSKEFSFFHS